MKYYKLLLGVSIRIIILFTVAMIMTFIPEHLRDFFGDTPHDCKRGMHCLFDRNYNWGARHYFYWWMAFFLFLTATVVTIASIKEDVEELNE